MFILILHYNMFLKEICVLILIKHYNTFAQRHEGGHRDIVRKTVFCVHFNHLSIYMDPCTTCVGIKKSWREKKMYGCFVSSMMKLFDASKKSEVESRDDCVLLELAPAPGTIIPSLRTSFHSLSLRIL